MPSEQNPAQRERRFVLPTQQTMRSDLRRWGSHLDTLRWSDEGIIVAWLRESKRREGS